MTNEITLREYVDVRFKHFEVARQQAEAAMEKRLDGMNEFRETLRDQASRFPTKTELDAILKAIDSDIRYLREAKALLDGKASQKDLDVVRIFAVVGVIGTLVGIVLGILNLVAK